MILQFQNDFSSSSKEDENNLRLHSLWEETSFTRIYFERNKLNRREEKTFTNNLKRKERIERRKIYKLIETRKDENKEMEIYYMRWQLQNTQTVLTLFWPFMIFFYFIYFSYFSLKQRTKRESKEAKKLITKNWKSLSANAKTEKLWRSSGEDQNLIKEPSCYFQQTFFLI